MEILPILNVTLLISIYLVIGAGVSCGLTVQDIREHHARFKYWQAKLEADLKRYNTRLTTADADERVTVDFLIETAKKDLAYEKDQLYGWRFKIFEGFIWPMSLLVLLIESYWVQKKSRQFSDWVFKSVIREDPDGL